MSSGPFLTVSQTARLLGLSPFSIYRMAEGRDLPHYRIGKGIHKRIRFDPAELDRWLQGQHVLAKDESRRLRRRP